MADAATERAADILVATARPRFYRLGAALTTQPYRWFSFERGEELEPVTGLEADWVFQLSWGLTR